MRPSGSPAAVERRGRRAIELLERGFSPVEVARQLGVDRRSVRRWKAAHLKGGESGIRARPASGRPSALDDKAKARLERIMLKGTKAAGFPIDLWTCSRVAEVIDERFGVEYHVDHVGRLLRGLGWGPQKPTSGAAERDEAAARR